MLRSTVLQPGRRLPPGRRPSMAGLLLLAPLLASQPASLARAQDAGGYRVGVGDQLSISVFPGTDTEPISIEATVAGDGTVDVIHVGPYLAAGQPTSAIRDGIRQALVKRGIFVSPQVAVNVTDYRSQGVNVSGLVNKPGRYYLRGPTRLLDILSEAEGVDEANAANEVHVIRTGRADPIRIVRRDLFAADAAVREAANIVLQADDTVHVPRLAQFCIMGPVTKPGCYDHRPGMTLEEAISKAEGLDTTKADRHDITIRRTTGGGSVELKADLGETGSTGSRFPIEEADQVVVGEAVLAVTVEGMVGDPGKIDWFPGMTITDAIAEAGGSEGQFGSGNLKKVVLRRDAESRQINVKEIQKGKAPDVDVRPGDRIYVPRNFM
jgi:polysaccharide export outer membrane protein